MGLASTMVRRAVHASNPFDERYWGDGGVISTSGMRVDGDTALTFDACFACVAVIAEDVATLPVDVLRKRPGGRGRDELPDHQISHLFNVQANGWQTGLEWREWMTRVAVFYPEAVSERVRGPRSVAEELRPLLHTWLKKETLPDGSVRYEVNEPQKARRYLALDEVFRLPSRLGAGLLQLMRDDIGTALSTSRTAALLMKSGLTPRMGLEHPKGLSLEAQLRLSQSVRDKVSSGEIPVFEEGMKWVKIGIDPEDVQMVAQQEFSVLKMARWMRLQPHKIAHMVKASYASIEQQNIEHVIDTVRPWAIRWETAVAAQLLAFEAGVYLRHNLAALLRGDALSQAQALEIGRRNGVYNANEWRELLDLNPRDDEGGEQYWDTQPGTGSQDSPPGGKKSRGWAIAEQSARRLVAKEVSAVKRNAVRLASDWEAWQGWCGEFFGEHAQDVARTLVIGERAARMYCEAKREELVAEGLEVIERWEARDVPLLVELSLEGDE